MATSDYIAPGFSLTEIENRIAILRYAVASYSAAATAQKLAIDYAITQAGQAAALWEGRGFWWSKRRGRFLTIASVTTATVARTSNVATITTDATHGLTAGSHVRVYGCTETGYDTDDALVLSVSAGTKAFTYDNTGDDDSGTADTTGEVYCHSFPLRTINSSSMTDMSVPTGVFVDDDYPLGKMIKDEFDDWLALYPTSGGGQPMQYCIWEDISSTLSSGLMIGFIPIPTAEHTIKIPYIRRHSKITNTEATTSNDTALIVPAEWHQEIYIDGALFLLRNEKTTNADLTQCPPFMRAIRGMAAQDPSRFGDVRADVTFDPAVRTWTRPNGDILSNVGSVTA